MPHLPVVVAAAFAAGVITGASWPSWLTPLAIASGVAWAASLGAWRRRGPFAVAGCALATVALAGGVLGALAMRRTLTPRITSLLEAHDLLPADGRRGTEAVRFEGRLVADAAPSAFAVVLRVELTRVWVGPCACAEPVDGAVLVTVGGAVAAGHMDTWRAGRLVQATGTLRRPTSFRNHGAPDPAIEMARRRTSLIAAVKSALVVEVVARGSLWQEAAAAVRARARQALARAAGPGTTAAAVATAVLIGDRAGLDPTLEDRLQRAGTFHVIAISGGNIALWSLGTLWLASRLTRRRPLALAAAAAALIAYAAVVGSGASVQRATGMALVGIATEWLDQRGAAVNVLALTAALLVALDPLVAFDVGFWLTTAATAGLVVGLPSAPAASRLAAWMRVLVLTSVWAEAALLPVTAQVFQQVTVAGVVLSALAIPAMAVVQVAALAAVMSDLIAPALLPACGTVLHLASAAVTGSARLVEYVPGLSWRVPPPGALAIGAYLSMLAAWVWSRRPAADTAVAQRVRQATLVGTPAAALWIAVAPLTLVPVAPGDLSVAVLDVGQGDAVFVQFPNGRTLLVDAGGAAAGGRDLGARVIGPTLRARGVRRLDYLLVTHADSDHIGGAATLTREFRPAEVWSGIPVEGDEATAALRVAAEAVGASWREVRRGERLHIGGVRLDVVHPPVPDWARQQVRNDDSVVVALRYDRVRVLLTGDIGAEAEADVAAAIGVDDTPPGLTVLKVAHHGSRSATSAAWLAATRPALAVVSAGAANPFGHPALAVLARLAEAGVDLWRTDRDGEVRVRTNGAVVEVVAHDGRRRWLSVQPR